MPDRFTRFCDAGSKAIHYGFWPVVDVVCLVVVVRALLEWWNG